jgi:hypothetical protein
VVVAVETKSGTVVEHLQEIDCCIFPVHPQSAKAYRQRKVPSGNKTDHVDAWSLADALRLNGANGKQLATQEPLIKELRLLCRDEVALIRDRTALITQLRQASHDYCPAALEAFDDWTMPAAWAFIVAFPTPEALVKGGKRKWEKFLRAHKLGRPETYQRRLEIFARADRFAGSPPAIHAKSRLAVTRAKQLQLLQTQINEYRQEIRRLFAQAPVRPASQFLQKPQETLKGGQTQSPTLIRSTPSPVSTTWPRFSWPSTRPFFMSVRPSYICKSEPQMLVLVIFTSTSVGRSIFASGTFLICTSRGPL